MLDAKKDKVKRMFFLNQEAQSTLNRTVTVSKGRKWEDKFTVYLLSGNIHDKLTSLDLQVRYALTGDSVSGGRSRRELRPVLGQFEKMTADSISIMKDCGPDNLCIPNLSLGASQ